MPWKSLRIIEGRTSEYDWRWPQSVSYPVKKMRQRCNKEDSKLPLWLWIIIQNQLPVEGEIERIQSEISFVNKTFFFAGGQLSVGCVTVTVTVPYFFLGFLKKISCCWKNCLSMVLAMTLTHCYNHTSAIFPTTWFPPQKSERKNVPINLK